MALSLPGLLLLAAAAVAATVIQGAAPAVAAAPDAACGAAGREHLLMQWRVGRGGAEAVGSPAALALPAVPPTVAGRRCALEGQLQDLVARLQKQRGGQDGAEEEQPQPQQQADDTEAPSGGSGGGGGDAAAAATADQEALAHVEQIVERGAAAFCDVAGEAEQVGAGASPAAGGTGLLQARGAMNLDEMALQMNAIMASARTRAGQREVALNASAAAIASCSADVDLAMGGGIASQENATVAARTEHAACRAEEGRMKEAADGACAEFEEYWSALQLPECAAPLQPQGWEDALACVRRVSNWSGEAERQLLDRGGFCHGNTTAHGEKRGACDAAQHAFEGHVCRHRKAELGGCEAVRECHAERTATHEALVQEAERNETEDKIAYESAESILCDLRVLNETQNLTWKAELRRACASLQPDSSVLNATLPEVPPQPACNASSAGSQPCEGAWLRQEYNRSWAALAPAAECSPCERKIAANATVEVGAVAWTEPNPGPLLPSLAKVDDDTVAACWSRTWCRLFGVNDSSLVPLGTELRIAHHIHPTQLLLVEPGRLIRFGGRSGSGNVDVAGLVVAGTQLQEGNVLGMEYPSAGISAALLGGGRAVVCYSRNSESRCNVVSSEDGLTYQQGPNFLAAQDTYDSGLLRVGVDTAVLCWSYRSWKAVCRVLRASGMSLAWGGGEEAVLPFRWASYSRIRGLSPHVAVVCSHEGCVPLAINGSTITVGQLQSHGINVHGEALSGVIAKIWEDRMVWCGVSTSPHAYCRLMQVQGNMLTMGEVVPLPMTEVAWPEAGDVVALADGRALLCYAANHGGPRECRFLTVPTVGGHD